MKETLSNAATLVLVICAVVVAGLIVKREFFSPPPAAGSAVRPVSDWKELADGGAVLGSRSAPLKIVEFSDFQCPYCAQAHFRLTELRRKHADRMAVVYRHYPLEAIHPHAHQAAIAAECAGAQGKFEAYHDALFARQDSIGVAGWSVFAKTAGVPDTADFRRCVEESRFADRVAQDVEAGEKIGVNGTPMFIFDGKMITGTAAVDSLDKWISAQ